MATSKTRQLETEIKRLEDEIDEWRRKYNKRGKELVRLRANLRNITKALADSQQDYLVGSHPTFQAGREGWR